MTFMYQMLSSKANLSKYISSCACICVPRESNHSNMFNMHELYSTQAVKQFIYFCAMKVYSLIHLAEVKKLKVIFPFLLWRIGKIIGLIQALYMADPLWQFLQSAAFKMTSYKQFFFFSNINKTVMLNIYRTSFYKSRYIVKSIKPAPFNTEKLKKTWILTWLWLVDC